MARIKKQLLQQLQRKLGVSQRQVYRLVEAKAKESFLPSNLAALKLAADSGISLSRHATEEELAEIRQAARGLNAGPNAVRTVRLPNSESVSKRPRTKRASKKKKAASSVSRRGTSVFVVHGRNDKLRRSMFSFLRSIGLRPLEWRKAIALTKKSSPFVAQILDAAFREAVAIVVLFSPDDKAKLKKEFIKSNDPEYEKVLTGQARPNVLFEAGMAFGRNPDSTVLVQVGDVRPFSDVAGRHLVHLSNSPQSRHELVTKLANAGCNVDTDGIDWHSEGDFS